MAATVDRSLAPIPQRALPLGARPARTTGEGSHHFVKAEWARCWLSPMYFADSYCHIYDATATTWIPFHLWPAQSQVLLTIHAVPLTVILKARQLGLTWLVLSYILWLMLYRPAATISVFSRRQEEADYLLGVERLRGMFYRLPVWMQFRVLVDNERHWQLSNGSVARSFPTSAGDSYTATFAFADEFDLVEDQGRLIRAVKPTIDGGGKMVLLSKADKGKPESEFKRIYRSGKAGEGPWTSLFLPWYVRPSRDARWYQAQVQDSLLRTGALDDVHEGYPATDAEALSPRTLDKRFPPEWLLRCYQEQETIECPTAPPINGLRVFLPPTPSGVYSLGADPAEGNPTSDDSSLHVVDKTTGEECAVLAGKYEPEVFASHIKTLSLWYNRAGALVERNNHGHSVLAWLRDNAQGVPVLTGSDGKRGWLTTSASKVAMYDNAASCFREGDVTIHSFDTFTQLSSIDGARLKAPDGQIDDRATSFVLAQQARSQSGTGDVTPEAMDLIEEWM